MASYDSVEHALVKHEEYPALDRDLSDHDFQRRRVSSCVKFIYPGDIVLDVACNTGYYIDYCPKAAEVHGVDCSEALVEIAKKKLTTARVAAAEKLPFMDRSFDVVNVSGLLEQVFEPLAVMKEAARVSRRFVTGNTVHASGTWGKHRIEKHSWQSRSYTKEEIESILNQIGKIETLGTVDINNPPEPQCWYWCVKVG
jgi:ubiquinone/menaquinone biosynthesis C-methylase UbiE